MRQLLHRLAADGRTVFVSSHLMRELARVADRVLVIGRGRVLADCAVSELPARAGLAGAVRARCAEPQQLAVALGRAGRAGRPVVNVGAETVLIPDAAAADVAAVALAAGLALTELTTLTPPLEQAYLAITETTTQYHAAVGELDTSPDPR